ncbi:hypothetical protein MBLNU459_g6684t1 [Dothideomycetes sp. NU459]
MSASTPAKDTSTGAPKSASKSKQAKKVVVLRLGPALLAKFPSDSPAQKSPSSSELALPSTATPVINAPAADAASHSDDATPVPSATATASDSKSLAPPAAGSGKRKGVPGPKPGSKRAAPPPDGTPKPRGKPGPKKKPRLADGTIDRSADPSLSTKKGPFGGVAPISAHKLGPKANTGAINAGLRALDRSGKPCRRWERRGFSLKSIAGVSWEVGTWSAPSKDGSNFSGDVKSESSESGETKVHMESSAVSDRSNGDGDGDGDGDVTMQHSNGIESSPAPAIAAEA